MKTASSGLDTHIKGSVTTLANCVKVTRQDGVVFGFTDHDQDIIFNGTTYKASTAFQRTSVESKNDATVDNLNLNAVLNSTDVTDDDLRSGRYDYATVEMFLVNWDDLTQGDLKIRRGWLGEVTLKEYGYTAEIRGMTQAYSRTIVEICTPDCRADLGDIRCKTDLSLFTETGVVGSTAITIQPSTGGSGLGTGGGGTGGGGGLPGDGNGIAVIGSQTTKTNETGQNTSAYFGYNQANFASNFTGSAHIVGAVDGTKMDNSLNPAAAGFAGGGAGSMSGNVSKVKMASLAPPGSTSRIAVHMTPWWERTGGGHIHNGTNDNTDAQMDVTIDDLRSRGVQVAIMDWYGIGTYEDTVCQRMRDRLKARSITDLKLSLCINGGTIEGSTVNTTAGVNAALDYIFTNFYQNASDAAVFEFWKGRPLISYFVFPTSFADWTTVFSHLNSCGNPTMVFRNTGGFTVAHSDGSFAWVAPENASANDPSGLSYLRDFYGYVNNNNLLGSKCVIGATYPGFNDTLATWGQNRFVDRCNGQTWVRTWDILASYFTTSFPDYIQVDTYTDYEEGTQIELGIENYLAVTASVVTTTLSWVVSGPSSSSSATGSIYHGGGTDTISHYTVFISTDGENLTVVGNVTSLSFDLTTIPGLVSGTTYKLYVEAVGRPSIRNHFSNQVSWVKP